MAPDLIRVSNISWTFRMNYIKYCLYVFVYKNKYIYIYYIFLLFSIILQFIPIKAYFKGTFGLIWALVVNFELIRYDTHYFLAGSELQPNMGQKRFLCKPLEIIVHYINALYMF